MEEAFRYANDFDTWSEYGYFYPYYSEDEENPQNFTDISFNSIDHLLTLCGLTGHIAHTQTIENRNYMIGGELVIDPEITLTLSNGTDLYHRTEIADIIVEPTASLVIGNTSGFYNTNSYYTEIFVDGSMTINDDVSFHSSGGFYKIYFDGQAQVGSNVSFVGEDGGQIWFKVNNTGLNLIIDQAIFTNSAIISFNNQLTVSNSTFTYGGIYGFNGDYDISSSDFNSSFINISNASTDNRTIKIWNDCEFGGLQSHPAITIENYPNYKIEDCRISFCSEGIKLYNSGHGKRDQSIINNNIFRNSNAAICVYHSTADIYHNLIYSNGYGIMSYDRSSIHIEGNNHFVTQEIRDNRSNEIYASNLSFPQYLKWNLIQDDDNLPGDPLVKYAGNNAFNDVRDNCWGYNFTPSVDLEPSSGYIWNPIWDCLQGAGSGNETEAEALYLEAREETFEENYSAAKNSYEQIIEQYSESDFAKAAMKELYSIEEYTGDNYTALKDYYENDSVIQGDSSLIILADFLANFCDIKLENWPTAIAWFEDVIQEPETFEDSIFAIIDLGYTYWLMENSGFKSSYTGTMPQYKFASHKDYEENRDYLLSLLPGDGLSEAMKQSLATLKPGELLQNVPNPFNGTTQIWFKLTEESNVSVTIYDYTGKAVSVIRQGLIASGNHSVEFNSANLSSGIYFYSLEVNGAKTDSKKMTLMR